MAAEGKQSDEIVLGTPNLFVSDSASGSVTPLTSDILAAQKSLTFLQGLETPSEDILGGGSQMVLDQDLSYISNEHSSSYFSKGSSSSFEFDACLPTNDPFMVTDAAAVLVPSLNLLVDPLDPFSSLDSLSCGPRNFGTLQDEQTYDAGRIGPGQSTGISFQPSTSGNLCFPSVSRNPPSDLSLNPSQYSSSYYNSNPPLYTGFTVQGGRIPSIPCDTGLPHSFVPPDPLSPPMDGPQQLLPPPLIPTSIVSQSASDISPKPSGTAAEDPKEADKIDVKFIGQHCGHF